LNVFAIANSRMYFWIKRRDTNWKNEIQTTVFYTIDDVIAYANEHHLENLIAIDNTASADFVTNYISLVKIVSIWFRQTK
jgi:aspartokinase/homoserine dehydrogenase 1